MPSEFETFTLKKVDESKIQVVRNLDVKNKAGDSVTFKATEATIECTAEGCKLGAEKCLPPTKVDYDHAAVKTMQAKAKGKKGVGEIDESTVSKFMSAAILGDKDALKLIFNSSQTELGLDGATAEGFDQGFGLIRTLVELKCIKR
jgi:hypothetical protein